ncbi:MAG: flagellin FliC [Halobacteriovoraceae bacterium]|nr:flagellin FliC [Halobacteriovoraceae bacterium]
MGLRIRTNVPSIAAQRSLKISNRDLESNFRKLSSGQRITRSADDAAGLAISENLRAQIRGIRQARRNAEDGISMVQVAEGGMNEVGSMLIRMRELAIQAASDTIGQTERTFTDLEFQALKEEIERLAQSTEFNGYKVLNGTGGEFEIQIGTRNNPLEDRIKWDSGALDVTLDYLGMSAESIASKEGAQLTLRQIDEAILKVNGARAKLGAIQNRLTSVTNSLDISDENLSAANSRIRDVDVASETASLTRNQILTQAGTSVLSQANQSSNFALKLLGA